MKPQSLAAMVVRGAVLFGAWWLVQVPAKDMPLAPPGSNMPPVTKFKKVRGFASAGECEAFRDVALQDGAMLGSEAMLDETSTLRCVPAQGLADPTPGTPPPTP
jgi:hypothetical protein